MTNQTCINCKHFRIHYPSLNDSTFYFNCSKLKFNEGDSKEDYEEACSDNDCDEFAGRDYRLNGDREN